MPGALPPVLIEIKALSSEAVAKFHEVGDELEELDEKASSHTQKIAGYGKAAFLGLATGAVGLATLSLKAGVDYQSALATMQGAAGLTAAQSKSLGYAFLDTAGKSTFSAQEMVQAFGPVAGVVKQLAGGQLTAAAATQVMSAANDMAEASGMNLTASTSALVGVMQAFQLKTADAAGTSNMLFNVARTTGNGIDQLAGTVEKLHMKLGDASPSLADTSTLMVDLAQHGVAGSRGMLAMSTGMSTLLGGSTKTDAEMKSLGLSVFNSAGKFVGMTSVLAQLQPKLAGMSDAQRTAAEAALFGNGAAATLNATLLAGVAGYNTASSAVMKSGAVQAAASDQAKTLHGQMHLAAATAEDLAARFGLILIPMLEKLMQTVLKVVDWFEQHRKAAEALGIAVGTVLAGAIGVYVGTLVAGAAQSVISFGSMVGGWVGLGAAAEEEAATAGEAVASQAASTQAATAAMTAALESLTGPIQQLVAQLQEITGVSAEADASLESIGVTAEATGDEVAAGAAAAEAPLLPWIAAIALVGVAAYELYEHWNAVWGFIKKITVDAWDGIKRFFDDGINFVKAHWQLFADGLLTILLGPLGLIVGLVITHLDQIKQFFETVGSDIEQGWDTFWGAIKTAASTALSWMRTAVGDYVKLWVDLPGKILSAVSGFAGLLVNAGKQLMEGLIKGIGGAAGAVGHAIEHDIPGGGLLGKAAGAIFGAEGMTVNGPTLAVIGEGGETEWVVPKHKLGGFINAMAPTLTGAAGPALPAAGQMSLVAPAAPAYGSGSGGTTTLTVPITMTLDGQQIANSTRQILLAQKASGIIQVVGLS